jgi:hypothetical protein
MASDIPGLRLPKPFCALASPVTFGQSDIVERARIQLLQVPARFVTPEPNPYSRQANANAVDQNCPPHPFDNPQSAGEGAGNVTVRTEASSWQPL